MADADYIIVGAGSAGGVVAAALSKDPSRSVLLLEAGPDYATEAETPSDLLDGGRLPGMVHDWSYSAAPCAGRIMPYRRGREYILANIGSFNHPCGTAPMGSEDDPAAVTHQFGRLRGLGGLWIADASIMPRGVTMAIGERIAAWILRAGTA